MPPPEEMLTSLAMIANRARWLGVGWHAVVLVAVFVLLVGRRPRQRDAALLLVAPLASVAILAAVHQSPFNAAFFAVLSVWLVVLAALSMPREPVRAGPWWARTAGVCLIVFGFIYPHSFAIVEESLLVQLFTAPLGLVPSPTLALVTGFTLVAGGFESRPWTIALSVAGLFYGVFGASLLGVTADLVLIAGALTLLALLAPVPWHRRVKVRRLPFDERAPRFE